MEVVEAVAVDHLQVERTPISIASSISPWNSCLLEKENGCVVVEILQEVAAFHLADVHESESDAFENENVHEIDCELQ